MRTALCTWLLAAALSATFAGSVACQGTTGHAASQRDAASHPLDASASDALVASKSHTAHLPLTLMADVPLPGGKTRFDYQDVDEKLGHLVVTHMNDGSVLFLKLSDGSVLEELKGIPVARGVVVASDVGRVFVTSSPNKLVVIDSQSMKELARVDTGAGPDGVGWDPVDQVVGVSDQNDGAISLIGNAGTGTHKQVKLGSETGNVVFDATRGWFWITVVMATPPNQLVALDPVAAKIKTKIDLPGCGGAHGLRLHPDAKTAFIACESSAKLIRVELESAKLLGSASTGTIPDVMNIDRELGWLYMAAEDGNLTVFDINKSGVVRLGRDKPGANSHSVAVDVATHRVFFPLMVGPKGTPVLRIMRPAGIQ